MIALHSLLMPLQGVNDGLVSVSSSQWGETFPALPHADHLDQINWRGLEAIPSPFTYLRFSPQPPSSHFNALEFYASILEMLAKRQL